MSFFKSTNKDNKEVSFDDLSSDESDSEDDFIVDDTN